MELTQILLFERNQPLIHFNPYLADHEEQQGQVDKDDRRAVLVDKDEHVEQPEPLAQELHEVVRAEEVQPHQEPDDKLHHNYPVS